MATASMNAQLSVGLGRSASASGPPTEALGLRFQVDVSPVGSLGDWQKCEGLSVEYDIFEYKEGGVNAYVHRLPGRAKYQNIRLTRPISPGSREVAAWVSQVQTNPKRSTATIKVLDASGKPVAQWTVTGVFPAKWTGPTLDVGANQVALEVLELAHNGFIPG